MEDVKDIHYTALPKDSPYVRPFRFNYTQNGKQKSWDLLEVHDSVAVIIFNITRKVMVFVKQFRPAVYYNSVPRAERGKTINTEQYPPSLGIALEMCAGIVDKNKPLKDIAQEEALEECGYDIPIHNFEKVCTYCSGVGVQGAQQTLYYVEATDSMRTGQGGGVDDEIIEVVEMTIPQVEQYMQQFSGPVNSPPSCLFALMWFIHNKADKFRK